jgi:hypothetical protein
VTLDAKRLREIAATIGTLLEQVVAQGTTELRVLEMYLKDAKKEAEYLVEVSQRAYPLKPH